MVTQLNAFTLSKKIENNSPSPTRKTHGLADTNKKSTPHILYQVQQQTFKDGLIL